MVKAVLPLLPKPHPPDTQKTPYLQDEIQSQHHKPVTPIAAFDRPPNPKAAQLFINWYLSRDGQNTRHLLLNDDDPYPSIRTDVAQGKVTDERWLDVRHLDPNSIPPRGGPEDTAQLAAAIDFMREICMELGCYGY